MLIALALPAAARAGDRLRVSLATATPGGGFPAYGDAFAAALAAVDPGLSVETRASGGSAENLGLLRAGTVDLALVQGEYAYPALGRGDGLSVLSPVYATPGLFVMRADGPVRAVADLRGAAVALGTRDSGLTVMGRSVLAAAGIDPAHDIRPVILDHAGDGPAMVLDGRVAALWGGGLGWPGFLAVARGPAGARFLGAPEAAAETLVRPGGALRRMRVPGGSFPGQAEPIDTLGSWSLVLARPGLEAATAHRIVSTLARAGAELRARHPQGAESDPANLAGIVPASWLNPGTARYLAEAGIRLP